MGGAFLYSYARRTLTTLTGLGIDVIRSVPLLLLLFWCVAACAARVSAAGGGDVQLPAHPSGGADARTVRFGGDIHQNT